MSSVVEKVQKLVALASSSNLEEARTAAYQACRLIRLHKLAIKPHERVEHVTRHDAATGSVHVSSNGRSSYCGENLEHGVSFYMMGQVPKWAIKNCCRRCLGAVQTTTR